MAKKDSIGRLCFRKDFFHASEMKAYLDLVFAFTSTNQVIIISKSDFEHLNSKGENLEFLGNCQLDSTYYTFDMPDNVDTALGKGDDYYFTVINKSTNLRKCPMICIRKQSEVPDSQDILSRTEVLVNTMEKFLEGFEEYLKEDIDD